MSKTITFIAGMLLCAAPAFAQQAASPAQAAATAASSGPALPLSMEQAVQMAMEANLGLKADRLDVNIAAENIRAARAAYKPLLSSAFNRNTSETVSGSAFEGGDIVSRAGTSFSSSLGQNIPRFGGRYNVSWSARRDTTTQLASQFNPTLGSSVAFGVSQPLLRNFRIDSQRASVQNAERGRTIADLTLERQITATRNSVQLAYLGLIGAIKQLEVANQNMALAQKSLDNFRARVAVGVSADIEVIQQEASVARQEESIVVAEAGIDTAMDNLRALILDPARADYWQLRLQPTDTITAVPKEIDVEAATRNALANRIDLVTMRRQQEITALNLRLSENQVKPALDFNLNYQSTGTGGTRYSYDYTSGFPQVVGQLNRSFGLALSEAFGGTYPSWSMSTIFSYPLGNSAAKAQLARGRLEKRQEDLALQNMELMVATQVRNAARDVQANLKRVEVTQKARIATERQLEAENRKFNVGLSSSFELQGRESELANARVSELRAMIDYNRSLIIFERVQRIQ
jgi:outer membrane protein